MKKSLLAVAAMTAFAGAAQAQSSVTVYGILDVGFVASSYQGLGVGANAANTNNASTSMAGSATSNKQSTAGFGQSAESTSRIGFKGTEDLGGGTQAIFTMELGLSPNSNGAAASSTSVSTTAVSTPAVFGQINRQTFVGLHKNGVGAGTIGTQYTPLFDVQSKTDAAGNNNLVGNAVYSGNLQSGTGSFNQGIAPYAGAVDKQGMNAAAGAYVTRVSNALKFQSDRINGFAGQAFYAQTNQNTNQTAANFSGVTPANATSSAAATAAVYPGGANNNTAWGLNADYVWNKLNVVAAYQQIKSFDPAIASTTTTASGTLPAGTADSFGVNTQMATTYAAAVYDFGILKGYAQYITNKASAVQASNYGTSRTAYQLGARSQLTPVISLYATYGMGKSSYWQGGSAFANFRTMQVGSDYNLSKRTNLYVAYGSYNQSSDGTTTATSGGSTGVSGMNYAAGIRHTF